MRGFELKVEDEIRKGLRRHETVSRNKLELVECFNMAPRAGGLEAHEVITSLHADGVSWGGGAAYGVDDLDTVDSVVDG